MPVPIPVYVVEDLATHQPEVLRDGRWLSRQLVFSEVDAPAERARSLGMTVGVLAVGDSESPPEPDAAKASPIPQHDSTPNARPSAPPEAPDHGVESPAAPVTVHVEIAGRIATGIDRPRVGGTASAALLPLGLPLGVFLTGSWLTSSSSEVDVTSRWLSGGGGLVAVVEPTDGLLLDVRVACLRERWHVVAAETDRLQEEEATRTYNSLELEVGAAARVFDPLHIRLGAGLRTTPAQQVRVAGRDLGENPSPAPHGSLGILLRFQKSGAPDLTSKTTR